MNVTTMNNQAISSINAKPIDKTAPSSGSSPDEVKNHGSLVTQANISNEGMVGSFLSNLSTGQQAEVEAFVSQVHQQKSAGLFDAKSMAKQAPSSINELSAMLNVSTEDLLDHIPTEAKSDVSIDGIGQANANAVTTYNTVSQHS